MGASIRILWLEFAFQVHAAEFAIGLHICWDGYIAVSLGPVTLSAEVAG